MNKQQKILLQVLTPIILFLLFFGIGNITQVDCYTPDIIFPGGSSTICYNAYDMLDLEDSWFVWLIYFSLVGLGEFKILSLCGKNKNNLK